MAEYIEREAVVKAFCESCSEYIDNKCTYEGACDTSIIATVPVADVQPVKRGKWLHINDDGFIFCSECEHEAYWDTDYGQQLFDYCPYCGAKMTKQ